MTGDKEQGEMSLLSSQTSYTTYKLLVFFDFFFYPLPSQTNQRSNLVLDLVDWLTQLVQYQTTVREVADLKPDWTHTQGLQITEQKVLPL